MKIFITVLFVTIRDMNQPLEKYESAHQEVK